MSWNTTINIYVYGLIMCSMQTMVNIWVIRNYLTPRHNRKWYFALLFLLMLWHDYYFGLLTKGNIYDMVEILVYYPLIGLTLLGLFRERVYQSFLYLFATDWISQIVGVVVTFPSVMILCGFDMEMVEEIMDRPEIWKILPMAVCYFLCAWFTTVIWRFMYRRKGKLFRILCVIFCGMDILVQITPVWQSVILVLPAVAALFIWMFYYQNESDRLAREQFAHYQALEEVYRQKEKEISEIRHDIANHLNVMEAMRADSYGMDILRRIDKNASVSFTDVPVLDCLIREKAEICQEKGIVFERKGQNLGSINITEYELVSLFANLLDNAVEAAIKTTEKKIFLTMEMQQGFLKIVLRNSKLENEAPLKTQFETTKKDKKKHGIGSRIIKEIVNDHDGRIRYIDHGTEMETVIFIAI